MIVKLELNAKQLNKLHIALEADENTWYFVGGHGSGSERFVSIMSVKGKVERQGDLPIYHVDLEVTAHYQNQSTGGVYEPTPLDRLTRVLHAVGLFPL